MSSVKKIVIAGGSGFIGKCLIDYYSKIETEIIVLSRNPKEKTESTKFVEWDGKTIGNWANEIESADAVINLSGKSIVCRHNEKNKKLILNSRIDTTNVIGEAISQANNKPKVWINSSGVAIYSPTVGQPHTEHSMDFANDFMAEVVTKWEKALYTERGGNTRKVALRTSVVLGKNEGALKPLSLLTKFGLGGKQGSGKQLFSWVHKDDVVNMVDFIIKNEQAEGIINNAAPAPITNKHLMAVLRNQFNVPLGIPAPSWGIKLASPIVGIEPDFVLKSSNVVSEKLAKLGFQFQHSTIESAMKNLFS